MVASRSCVLAGIEVGMATTSGRHQAGVYTANSFSASGFGLLNDGNEELAIEHGTDSNHPGSSVVEETGQFIPFIAMKESVANGFTEPAEIVQDNLGGSSKLVLSRDAQMTTVERGEISLGLKTGHDEHPLRVQGPKRLSETGERGGSEGEREMIEDSIDGMVQERKGRIPVQL